MQDHGEEMKEGWHLDKKVPLSIIVALLIQTSALVAWGTRMDTRLAQLELSTASHAIGIQALKEAQNDVRVGLARIEERQIVTSEVVKEIKEKMYENNR